MTTFDPWLAQLRAAQKGPVTLQIDRGLPFVYSFALQADYTGSSLIGSIRLNPDAIDPTLADFTVSGPTVTDGVTTFGLSLTKTQTAALPADTDVDGVSEFAFDLLFTPDGGTQQRLFGGVAVVKGKVTNAS